MTDTVVITSPDAVTGVLSPTLTDAIAAAQAYWLLVQAAQGVVLTAEAQANLSANEALQAAASALSAAAAAASNAAALITPAIAVGTPTIQTRARIKRALNNAGQLQAVQDYLMNNYSALSDTALEWTDAPLMPVGGLVFVMIRAAVNYSDAQGRALWAAALALND
jgi:hypothetical protein